jgi:hypothetical protein
MQRSASKHTENTKSRAPTRTRKHGIRTHNNPHGHAVARSHPPTHTTPSAFRTPRARTSRAAGGRYAPHCPPHLRRSDVEQEAVAVTPRHLQCVRLVRPKARPQRRCSLCRAPARVRASSGIHVSQRHVHVREAGARRRGRRGWGPGAQLRCPARQQLSLEVGAEPRGGTLQKVRRWFIAWACGGSHNNPHGASQGHRVIAGNHTGQRYCCRSWEQHVVGVGPGGAVGRGDQGGQSTQEPAVVRTPVPVGGDAGAGRGTRTGTGEGALAWAWAWAWAWAAAAAGTAATAAAATASATAAAATATAAATAAATTAAAVTTATAVVNIAGVHVGVNAAGAVVAAASASRNRRHLWLRRPRG